MSKMSEGPIPAARDAARMAHPRTFLSGGEAAADGFHALCDRGSCDREASLPGFVDTHESEGSAGEREIFHEVRHVVHAFVGVLVTPKIVHDWGDTDEKSENGHGSPFGFDPEQHASAAENERNSRSSDSCLRSGDALGGGVICHGLALAKVVDAAIKEESAEKNSTDQEWSFHRRIPSVKFAREVRG